MRVLHKEGVAIHLGPESCAGGGNDAGEALTGVRAGRVLSSEIVDVWGADDLGGDGRQHLVHRYREMGRDPAESKTPSMHGSTSRRSWEIPCSPARDGLAGRIGKSDDVRR